MYFSFPSMRGLVFQFFFFFLDDYGTDWKNISLYRSIIFFLFCPFWILLHEMSWSALVSCLLRLGYCTIDHLIFVSCVLSIRFPLTSCPDDHYVIQNKEQYNPDRGSTPHLLYPRQENVGVGGHVWSCNCASDECFCSFGCSYTTAYVESLVISKC